MIRVRIGDGVWLATERMRIGTRDNILVAMIIYCAYQGDKEVIECNNFARLHFTSHSRHSVFVWCQLLLPLIIAAVILAVAIHAYMHDTICASHDHCSLLSPLYLCICDVHSIPTEFNHFPERLVHQFQDTRINFCLLQIACLLSIYLCWSCFNARCNKLQSKQHRCT